MTYKTALGHIAKLVAYSAVLVLIAGLVALVPEDRWILIGVWISAAAALFGVAFGNAIIQYVVEGLEAAFSPKPLEAAESEQSNDYAD